MEHLEEEKKNCLHQEYDQEWEIHSAHSAYIFLKYQKYHNLLIVAQADPNADTQMQYKTF